MVNPVDILPAFVFSTFGLLFGGMVVLIIVVAVFARRQQRKRAAAFAQVASFLGLRHQPGLYDPWAFTWRVRTSTAEASLLTLHASLAPFRGGHGKTRRTENVMEGSYRGHDVTWCEYKFVVSSGKSSQTVTYGVAMVRLAGPWPEVTIVPEGLDRKVVQLFGGDDIDFESEEFSARHWVKAEDRKFAYDIIHPRSMELIESTKWKRWHIQGEWMCLWDAGIPSPDDVQTSLDAAIRFVELAPNFRRPAVRRIAVPS